MECASYISYMIWLLKKILHEIKLIHTIQHKWFVLGMETASRSSLSDFFFNFFRLFGSTVILYRVVLKYSLLAKNNAASKRKILMCFISVACEHHKQNSNLKTCINISEFMYLCKCLFKCTCCWHWQYQFVWRPQFSYQNKTKHKLWMTNTTLLITYHSICLKPNRKIYFLLTAIEWSTNLNKCPIFNDDKTYSFVDSKILVKICTIDLTKQTHIRPVEITE